MEKDYHNLTASDEIKFVKHNPTDIKAFNEFQAKLDVQYEQHEREKTKREVVANLKRWTSLLPPRWSNAVLKQIMKEHNPEAARAILQVLEEQDHPTSFYIKGLGGSGKTYLAYAILRRFIGMNWATPSQIKIISEEAIMGFAGSGFEGNARFNELLRSRYSVYLFDGLGARTSYSQKEQQLWEQLIDHIYSKSLTAIFTSNRSAADFASCLSDSAESKLHHLLDGKIIEAKGNGKKAVLNDDSPKAKATTKKESESYGLWQD